MRQRTMKELRDWLATEKADNERCRQTDLDNGSGKQHNDYVTFHDGQLKQIERTLLAIKGTLR